MSCRFFRDTMLAFLDGELEPADRACCEEHLRLCEACRRDFAKASRMLSAAASALAAERIEPSEDFDARFYSRLERQKRAGLIQALRRALAPLLERIPAPVFVAVPVAAAALVAVSVALWPPSTPRITESEMEFALSLELAEDLDVLENLDILEDIEYISELPEAEG